jgi:hypothetical protein
VSALKTAVTRPIKPVKYEDPSPPCEKFDQWWWRFEHPEGTKLQLARARLAFQSAKARVWLHRHRLGTAVMCSVLLIVGVVHAMGMFGWPGLINYDEGVYMQQAWAVGFKHRIMPGTYIYDHPYFGWAEIAMFIRPFGLLYHFATAVSAGRAFMLLVHLVNSVFVYLLARRMKLREVFAGTAVLLFGLSPLGLLYQRLVFLDNLALMWLIIAFWCLMSPGRGTTAAKWAGVSLGLTVMCKETFVLPGLALLIALFDYRDRRNGFPRLLCFAAYGFFTLVILYVVYALAKHELLPGAHHVSLIGTAEYQLFNRKGTGSLLDPHSGTYHAAMSWLHQDFWILGVGSVAAVACLFMKRARAVAVAQLIQIAAMCRNGYLPYAYATALFPFAALSVAAVADHLWSGVQIVCRRITWDRRLLRASLRGTLRTAFVAAILFAGILLSISWKPGLETALGAKPNIASKLAADYITAHIPKSAIIVTNDDTFTDLAIRGLDPISEFKPDNDPAVRARLPRGWQSIGYLVLGPNDTIEHLRDLGLPTVADALVHAHPIAKFQGGLALWKVVPGKT